ncbi:hypothetical protein QJS10_CPA09g00818 [Acorus calamus]|uniref:Uncharacterized protein n=1 Tax=Acorus calamus TaxID=4465 RepID=A0AAV9E5Z4_ACOCL|nr:hypothetical protein QJS10_CPA09g00818 [Acorus calamus]
MCRCATSGDKSIKASVVKEVIPAGLWAILKAMNEVIFRNKRFYFENLCHMVLLLLGMLHCWGEKKNYYVLDDGYPNRKGFLAPYRNTRMQDEANAEFNEENIDVQREQVLEEI